MSQRTTVRRIVRAALIAAVYVALCLALPFMAYGPVQVRVAEALTLLPVLCPEAVVGVTLGCFLSNMVSGVPLDMVIGTATTLLAALASRRLRQVRWRGLPVAAVLPPVLFNAVIVGAELSWLYLPAGVGALPWLWNMATVGIGQLISCAGLGLPMLWAIERTPALRRLMADERPARPV